jgi:hypothetical protein
MADRWGALVKGLFADLEWLWVGGLALLQLCLVNRWLPLEGEPYEWAQYLLLGTLFPALLLAISQLESLHWRAARLSLGLKLALAVFCLWLGGRFLFLHDFSTRVLIICLGHCVLLIALTAVRSRFRIGDRPLAYAGPGVVRALLLGVSWFVAVRLVWWTDFTESITGSPATLSAFLVALVLVTLNLGPARETEPRPRSWLFWIGNFLGLLTVLFASVRIDYRFEFSDPAMAFHHWGVIAGPAELVRQGGWLLWDVPSQYGFLSTLTLAWLPTRSVWQSLYVVYSALLFLSAGFLFLLLRSLRTGVTNWMFSLAVTLAAFFLLPGYTPLLTGPFGYPSVSAYRFFWCYALLAVLVWEHCGGPQQKPRCGPLWVGNGVWLLGSLWSAESAAYCLAIWLPAYFLMVLRRARTAYPDREQRGRRLGFLTASLSVPPFLVLLAVGGIAVYYALALGHLPDVRAYFDYVLSLDAFALPANPDGAVWTLVLVASALATVAFYLLTRQGGLAGLSLCTGAGGALWAVSSYFVGRSHDANIVNLSPMLCTAVALGLYLLAREPQAGRLSALVRLSCLPLLTVMLTAAFGDEEATPESLRALNRGYIRKIDRLLPVMDPAFASLLESAHAQVSDPVLFIDRYIWFNCLPARWVGEPGQRARLVSMYRAWLPASPFALVIPLPDERKQVYLSRFSARTHLSGWLVDRNPPNPRHAWLFEQLEHTHTRSRTYSTEDWQLTWYEWKPN